MHWVALLPVLQPSSASPIDPHSLGIWSLQFTPRVTLVEDLVLAEVEASVRLFGGIEALHAQIEQGADALGAHVSWAPTGIGAIALARQGINDGFAEPLTKHLDHLPLEAIAEVARHKATLARVGCRTLGQVRALPRGGLSRRFGKSMLEALDRAYGVRPEAYEWLTLPETFHARLELLSRVETAPALLFGAKRLLQQMCGWLRARQLGATAFTLRWCHDVMRARDVGSSGELTIHTAEATQNIDHFTRLLAEHLAKVQLQAPVGDLELLASEVAPVVEESRSLIPDAIRRGASTELALERIQARLGESCIRRPKMCLDHRLEWMHEWSATPTRKAAASLGTGQLPVPSWVLDEPLRLVERNNRPQYQGPLELLLGPDRVEGGWWHRSGEGIGEKTNNVQRDYWLALSPHAGILWVFQQRLAGDATAWYLHGHYG